MSQISKPNPDSARTGPDAEDHTTPGLRYASGLVPAASAAAGSIRSPSPRQATLPWFCSFDVFVRS